MKLSMAENFSSVLDNRARIKVVFVGDGGVGKTSMLASFRDNRFPVQHVPTVFDNYSYPMISAGQEVILELWDTAGQETYDQLRQISYRCAHVFVLCFNVMQHSSFENVSKKWVPELLRHSTDTPILLIGTQKDLRKNSDELRAIAEEGRQVISALDGANKAKKVGALAYLECSALTQEGLYNVFDTAARAGMAFKTGGDLLGIKSDGRGRNQGSESKKNCAVL